MFRGANAINLDTKGRLAIPSRYRDVLKTRSTGQLVVTVNNTKERCLWMYPLDEWQSVEEKLVNLPSFDANHQRLKRFLIGYASEIEMDKSGRVLLPAPLREFARLEKATYLVGQGNKFEIWNEELWNARCSEWIQDDSEPGTLSTEMEQLSL
ncbi:MAG: division/cell wall cluster transcriptional repressor MraZ [Pseudomonadota bacterium]